MAVTEAGSAPDPQSELAPATLRRYSVALHAYLVRRLRRRRKDAADLTQEIFERFLRKRGRPEVIRNPLAYLYGIASHVIAETLEQEPYQVVTYDSRIAERAIDDETGNTDELSRQVGMHRDILWALGKLPEAQRMILTLVEGSGLSCKEAARMTGYSPGTVKVYLAQGRATLKTILGDYEDGKA